MDISEPRALPIGQSVGKSHWVGLSFESHDELARALRYNCHRPFFRALCRVQRLAVRHRL